MRIGVAGYPVPRDVPRERAVAWTIEEAARLGLQIIGGSFHPLTDPDNYRYDTDALLEQRALADEKGIEIEPYIRRPFDLVGPAGIEEAKLVRTSMRAARILGGPYVRTGYGRLKIESSRFNRAIPLED